ncbi:MAG: AzlC family ABC transporter permease [Acidimicrobiales bacterium]
MTEPEPLTDDGSRVPWWADARAGMIAVLPMLLGIVPFGIVAGATAVARGLGGLATMGFSALVFAGASQLAAIEVLSNGGSAVVAAVAACTINLRMLLYSASLAPYLAGESRRRRLGAAYVLVDQIYAASIAQWRGDTGRSEGRLPFFFGGGLLIWASWQLATGVGVIVGGRIPSEVPLDFAVPLVFLVLLIPTLVDRPALAAAGAGGAGAVLAAEVGAGEIAIVVGAVTGIVAGVLVEMVLDR